MKNFIYIIIGAKKKIYGEDMRFARIHEMVKMKAPISAKDKDYYLLEVEGYDEIQENTDSLEEKFEAIIK